MRCIVEGLDCPNCAGKIERALQGIPGLERIKLNFATKSLDLPQDKLEIAQEVIDRIEPGVKLVTVSDQTADQGEKRRLLVIVITGILFISGLVFNEFLHQTSYSWAEYAVLIPAYLLIGWPVIRKALTGIIRGELFDENFLMTVATTGAIIIHQLPEAVGVMLFYAVGEYFQEQAINRSRRSIKALLDIQPDYANLYENSVTVRVSPRQVGVGQTIIVKPGEKVPLDGEVISGCSYVDTSALTGESVPRKVETGEMVLAGMINGEGLLSIRVKKPYAESSVARILHLVEKAAERKAPVEHFITTFARYYTPTVVGLAALIALVPPLILQEATFGLWFYRALVLLAISCPCALMVSIPLGYFGGIGAASRHGILVKGANFLDYLAQLHTVVFDKTGTLTEGVFRVSKVMPKEGFSRDELLSMAAAAEAHSNHPIARSIVQAYADQSGGDPPGQVTEYREIPAHGISAVVDGHQVLAGNDRLMHREGIDHEDCDLEGTSIYIAIDRRYAGYIIISDQLKSQAKQTVTGLRVLGVKKVALLTGDEQSVARRVAEDLGLDEYFAQLLPEDKVRIVEKLEKDIPHRNRQKLAFIGDGVNDAPVITRADVGVALGGLGRDAAMEAADVVLMEDDPGKIVKAVQLGRRTRWIVRENIFLALGVKAFFIVLGSIGVAGIWEAVFADVGVTVLAVLNAIRTMRVK
ncbi:MAG TPA: heavy metal translocating P-type ATPase [Bacillota bacterium]